MYVPSSKLGPPTPSPASECALPLLNQKGGDTRLKVKGWGRVNSDDWRKSITLSLLCGFSVIFYTQLDDPLDAVAVHASGGVCGLLAVPVFMFVNLQVKR